jgi:Zn-dependent protease with chaperone function
VDGQRVRLAPGAKWKGKLRKLDQVMLGQEVRGRGARQPDGAILLREIDVRPNGDSALFESDVRLGTDALEQAWRSERVAFQAAADGHREVIGGVEEEGPDVSRIRRIVDRVAPPYLDRTRVRAYVVDSKEWNAMAMGNGAIWVFRGLLRDFDDDELAVIVGHELAHYTHEHTRRQMRSDIWKELVGAAAVAAAEAIDNDAARQSVQLAAGLTTMAWVNGYGRDLEDQADRVGLRYAHEGGYDVRVAPGVWRRFVEKYGDQDRVTNFFFSDHSQSTVRQKHLSEQIAWNYSRP